MEIMIRTRAVIERLDYDRLVERGVIPDMLAFLAGYPGAMAVKRYSPFVYSTKCFSFFGMMMDYIVRAGLRSKLTQPVDVGVDPVSDLIPQLPDDRLLVAIEDLATYETSTNMHDIVRCSRNLTSILYGEEPISLADATKYVPTGVNIMKDLVQKWTYFSTYLTGIVQYNVEYSQGELAGHPDVVTDQCILDIKTTCSFAKMSRSSFLQWNHNHYNYQHR